MDVIQAIILSIVEGITEFLPISSTGHLVLVSELLNIPQTEFVKSFEVIIQLGAILAIVLIYFKRLLQSRKLWPIIILAFIPTAIVGFTLYPLIKSVLLGNTQVTLWALFLGGIVLIVWEWFYLPAGRHGKEQPHHINEVEKLTYKKALLVGVFQSFSVVPGVSRAASTIIGGLTVGLTRKAAVEMSFFLAVPTMVAATGLDLIKSEFGFSAGEWGILAVGFIGAFITALFAVRFFLQYIAKHTFVAFGIYRIVLALVFWLFVL
jgi:undecaprenyl-diphosphatase